MNRLQKILNRRTFLSRGAKSVAAAGLAFPFVKTTKIFGYQDNDPQTETETHPTLEYRTLGRTGLEVTTVSYGAMRTRDEAIIHQALDMGINYIDTARTYMDGFNEQVVGNVLKNRRDDAYLATKILHGLDTAKVISESMDASLKALQVDYVDVIQFHMVSEVDYIKNETVMQAIQKIKEEGKARFIGFSTHQNQVALIKEAIKLDFYDMILVAYNFESSQELTDVIKEAAEAGIGIVAMKTQAGGYTDHQMGDLSPHQAALKWVLQNPGVTNAIPSMVTYAQLEEDIQAMGSQMGWYDRKTLHRYTKAIDKTLCRMCNGCRDLCPNQVNVFDVNRSLMYAEGYGDMELAQCTFRSISRQQQPTACLDCSKCSVKCVHGLNIQKKMLRALEIFS
ncbi:aldo/keto reductase [bacterium]|nr:aldo/keto reductase [bacterium]RQV98298.1 MAG: hypothetical protein EH221_02125 [bacterium]